MAGDPIKLSNITNEVTAPAAGDKLYILKVSTGESAFVQFSNLLASITSLLAVSNTGWISCAGALSYASATTIYEAGDVTGTYSVGDKFRMKQGGAYKYFYIVGISAYDSGNNRTTLTVTGGSDYTVANAAITDGYYSKGRGVGFPDWFNLTTPTWTTSGTAFTNQPTTNVAKFRIEGRAQDIYIKATCHATSGGTGIFIATFTAGQLAAYANAGSGAAFNHVTTLEGAAWISTASQNVMKIAKAGAALATNSEVFTATVRHEI